MSVIPMPDWKIDKKDVEHVLKSETYETILPTSIYDIKIASADGLDQDILSKYKGKVTLLFNVAAGCGNIPQHGVIEELNQIFKDEEDFNILAVVVDDFTCHGYPEFQDGIDKYIEKNNLDKTPAEVAKEYAVKHYNVTYQFSELTNGRHDKHSYDPNYVPGGIKQQDQHILWNYLTAAYNADIMENGVPYHKEEVPWSSAKAPDSSGKKIFMPLNGNFTKFLIDRTGTKFKRYSNGFLLGERDNTGNVFPWYPEKFTVDGKRDHNPVLKEDENYPTGQFPSPVQKFGIEVSLNIISKDIKNYLNS